MRLARSRQPPWRALLIYGGTSVPLIPQLITDAQQNEVVCLQIPFSVLRRTEAMLRQTKKSVCGHVCLCLLCNFLFLIVVDGLKMDLYQARNCFKVLPIFFYHLFIVIIVVVICCHLFIVYFNINIYLYIFFVSKLLCV